MEFSVQGNQLILEADDNQALTRALQGLCIRIARALNKMMGRSGKVFGDHYHARLLTVGCSDRVLSGLLSQRSGP